jgi:hypothetical protein
MLAAQPETPAPLSRLAVRRHDPRWEPGALAAHAGICAGGGEQSPSLPRRAFSITYEPHKFRWMLTRESCGVLPRSPSGPNSGRCAACKSAADPDLEQGGNTNVVVRREPATGEMARILVHRWCRSGRSPRSATAQKSLGYELHEFVVYVAWRILVLPLEVTSLRQQAGRRVLYRGPLGACCTISRPGSIDGAVIA